MKRTILLIQYQFDAKVGATTVLDGYGYGSLFFDYENSKDYVPSYEKSCADFLLDLKKDFISNAPDPSFADAKLSFVFFNCMHSLTEEL
jgi:hypothetical protein